jgi:hypothetical protein
LIALEEVGSELKEGRNVDSLETLFNEPKETRDMRHDSRNDVSI